MLKVELEKTWQLIKQLTNSKQNPKKEINKLKVDNKVTTDQPEIASTFNASKFNTYFTNIGLNLAEKNETG